MTVIALLSVAPVIEGSMSGEVAKAVDGDRVSTFLKIDDKRTRDQTARDKVDAVERELGREAKREREE